MASQGASLLAESQGGEGQGPGALPSFVSAQWGFEQLTRNVNTEAGGLGLRCLSPGRTGVTKAPPSFFLFFFFN